jgi:hypothetical protein
MFSDVAIYRVSTLTDESDEEEAEEDDIRPKLPKGAKNSQLTVGYKGDRSYVVRGNNIGVFSHTPEGVKYYGSISKIATPKGKEFQPKKVGLVFMKKL